MPHVVQVKNVEDAVLTEKTFWLTVADLFFAIFLRVLAFLAFSCMFALDSLAFLGDRTCRGTISMHARAKTGSMTSNTQKNQVSFVHFVISKIVVLLRGMALGPGWLSSTDISMLA